METTMAQLKPIDHRGIGPHEHDAAPVLTPVESRQGVISGRVLLILTTSLLLAGVAFAILYGIQIS
jgi:hypothetical protein